MGFRSTPFGESKPFEADPRITAAEAEKGHHSVESDEPATADPESDQTELTIEQRHAAEVELAKAEAQAHWEAKLAAAVTEAEQNAAVLAQGVSQLEGLRVEVLKQTAEDIGSLVRLIAERVLDQSLALHPEALKSVVQHALEQLPEAENLVVHVSPGQVEQITRVVDNRCRIQPDADVGAGCVIRSRHVTLDSTLEAAMEGVDSAVRTWLTEQPWVSDWMLE